MKRKLLILRYDWPLHLILLLTNWMPDNVIFLRIRGLLTRPFFGRCGSNLRLGRNLTFYNPSKIEIGNNVYIAEGNWFSAGERIQIGNEVMFGPKSVITSSSHTLLNGSYRYAPPKKRPIVIKNGSWIAAHCTITAGTLIQESVLVSANSVTRGEIPSNVVYGGNPGKIIRTNA
jgi:acetyltransferase-like isoleucine patch superfamily enzyme